MPDLLSALVGAGIEVLADVRSMPGSRRSPQFDADAMPGWLAPVEYVRLPALAGRRPRQDVPRHHNAGWQNVSFRNYADYTLTSAYARGLTELEALARGRRVAIMCGEPMPWRCHRSLVASTLVARGWTVTHLVVGRAAIPHRLGAWGPAPVVVDQVVIYPS